MKKLLSAVVAASLSTVSLAISVRDFGAVGDGVHDDTLAIQKAADALYPDNQRADGRDLGWFASRYRKGLLDGPNGELFFPRGTYRLTGPVRFLGSVNLRGEEGTTVLGSDSGEDMFYFHIGYRVHLENLAFRGGHIQIRQWTKNLSDAVLYVRNCSFADASGCALVSDSWQFKERPQATSANYQGNPPYDITRLPSGRYALKAIDPAKLQGWPNSTEIVVEGCRFANNRQAFHLSSDGVFVRDSVVSGKVQNGNVMTRVGGTAHVKRVRFSVDGEGLVVSSGRDTVVEGCRFEGSAVPVRFDARLFRSNIVPQLILKNNVVAGSATEIIRFPNGDIPNQLVVDGLTSEEGVRRRLFAFGRIPTSAEVANWPTEKSKGVKWGHPIIPVKHCLGIVARNVDASRFDLSLPESLEPFRRAPGNVPRAKGLRLGPESDFSRAVVRTPPADCGSARLDSSRDDTATLRALFAAPTNGTDGIMVVLPPRWYRLKGTISLSGRVRVVCHGRAVLTSADDQDVFALEEGSDVLLENLLLERGRHAIRCEGRRGHVLLRYDSLYGQLEESISAVADGTNDWLVELSGGTVFSPFLYRGNAHVKIDGYWHSVGPDRDRKTAYAKDFAAVVNLAGGVFEAEDVIGVPRYFDNDEIWSFKGDRKDPTLHGNYRWFDNHGTVNLKQYRFGGERGGLTPLCHFPGARTHVEGGFAAFRNCWRLTATPTAFLAMPNADAATLECIDVRGFDFLERHPLSSGRDENCYPYRE